MNNKINKMVQKVAMFGHDFLLGFCKGVSEKATDEEWAAFVRQFEKFGTYADVMRLERMRPLK